MSIETTLFSIFGGNEAADEIADAARRTRDFVTTNFEDQKGAISPYQRTGQSGLDLIERLLSGGADEIGASGEAILKRGIDDVIGRYAAMGLSDSGAGRSAVFDAATRIREMLRANRFNEALGATGIGQNAISQLLSAGGMANRGVAGANATIGEAKAFPWLNASNSLFRFEDQLQKAAGQAAGGGFA